MKREVNLRFDGKDIMFDAFAEMIADNGNYIWGMDGTICCYIDGEPFWLNACRQKCCAICSDNSFPVTETCEYLKDLLQDNDDNYIYHFDLDDEDENKIIITAKTFLNN